MRIVNSDEVEELEWTSPRGAFAGAGKQISEALGREPESTDLLKRQPFDIEIARIRPGCKPYPYHSHSLQWEFYHVMSGRGRVRHSEGTTAIRPGDAFVFAPGEPHQLINDGTSEDLIVYVVADNPMGESTHFPDSEKYIVRSPQRRIMRSAPLDYYDGEE